MIETGWEICFSEEGKKNYEKYKNENIIPVSVIGESNRGKSYLLEKICNIDVPKGFTEKTEGISVKYFVTEQLKCALIDTAGGQTPIIKNEKYNKFFKLIIQNILINDAKKEKKEKEKNEEKLNKKIEEIKKIENIEEFKKNNENIFYRALEELILDKTITEQIIKDYVLYKSRIIFVVVGQLTIDEQLLINNLKIENGIYKIYDEIIVIHNLYNFVKISQVKNYINDVLKKSIYFNLEERPMNEMDDSLNQTKNNIYFIEKSKNNNISQVIRHLIIANDSKQSEAGNYYNFSSINFLRNVLISVSNPKKFDVIEELKDFLSEKSFNYIENEKSNNKTKPIEKENFEINNNKMVLKNIENLKLKRLVTDESGNFKYFGNAFSPPFSYYKEFVDNVEYFVIAIELAGKIKKLRQKISLMNNGKYFISITGIKELPSINNYSYLFSDIDENEFRIEFEINVDEYELKNTNHPKNTQNDGIIKLFYELKNDNENSKEVFIEEIKNKKKKKKK